MERPRLSSEVRARRHVVGATARVILHAPGDRVLAVRDREWRVLSAMDGTRDLPGVAAKSGVPLDEVRAFARTLGDLGLLCDPPSEPLAPPSGLSRANAFAPDRPVRALPGYRFRCDGTGGCCRMFGTVAFTPLEAARARASRPDVLSAGHRERLAFFPERGLDETLLAVAMRDGACAYLADDGRCGIHAAAGAEHKPFGCRTFPARFVDVGDEIRAVPRPECACVFDEDPDGDPLTETTSGAELPRETFVPRLPERVTLGREVVGAAQLVAWCDEQELPIEGADLAAWCDAKADALDGGLGADPGSLAVGRMLAAAERLDRQNADWRAPTDWIRQTTGWILTALRALERGAESEMRDPAAERLYVRAALFGCSLAAADDVQSGLRELALHLRVARAFPLEAGADPAGRHPLALVEALARAHGLGL